MPNRKHGTKAKQSAAAASTGHGQFFVVARSGYDSFPSIRKDSLEEAIEAGLKKNVPFDVHDYYKGSVLWGWGQRSYPSSSAGSRPGYGLEDERTPKSPRQLDAEIETALSSPRSPRRLDRFVDLQRQGFMKRSPIRKWVIAVEDPSGDPSEATYIEAQGRTETAALRAAQARKPGRRLTLRYEK